MMNDFLDFTDFTSISIFSKPYIFLYGRTAVYYAVQSKSCTAFVPYKKKVVRPYISLRTSGSDPEIKDMLRIFLKFTRIEDLPDFSDLALIHRLM